MHESDLRISLLCNHPSHSMHFTEAQSPISVSFSFVVALVPVIFLELFQMTPYEDLPATGQERRIRVSEDAWVTVSWQKTLVRSVPMDPPVCDHHIIASQKNLKAVKGSKSFDK
jgi:hypothetical protein